MREALIDTTVSQLYPAHSGFMSGAVLSNIVDRTKKLAIKEYLARAEEDHFKGLTQEHLDEAIKQELAEQRDMVAGLGLTEPKPGAFEPAGNGPRA